MTAGVAVLLNSQTLGRAIKRTTRKKIDVRIDLFTSLQEAEQALRDDPTYIAAITNPSFDTGDGASIDLILDHEVPCIVLTSSFKRDFRRTLIERGVSDYVLKDKRCIDNISRLLQQMAASRGVELLVVDDSQMSRKMASRYLTRYGYVVHLAESASQALEILEAKPGIRVVLADYTMPEMSGAELVQQIRNRWSWKEKIIIGVSNTSDRAVLTAEFLKRGANDFLTKPYEPEELLCRVSHQLELLRSIEALRTAQERAEALAQTDALTGIFNRRAFFAEGGRRLAESRGSNPPALVMVDIDHFKAVNDTYGHPAGDAVIRALPKLCAEHLSEGDVIGRLGGEEFALLLLGASPQEVLDRAEKMRARVASAQIDAGQPEPITVTMSLGLAYHQCGETIDDMLHRADEALYDAKEAGRNRATCWSAVA